MDTHYLRLQERVRNKDLIIQKVRGDVNAADIGTKHLTSIKLVQLMELLNYKYISGRAEACPELSSFSLSHFPQIKTKRTNINFFCQIVVRCSTQ